MILEFQLLGSPISQLAVPLRHAIQTSPACTTINYGHGEAGKGEGGGGRALEGGEAREEGWEGKEVHGYRGRKACAEKGGWRRMDYVQ